jgi:RNA polymerase sigma factor (sigma-70 family)
MEQQPPFEMVVERYGPMVLRVCRAVVGPADADDAWSETFLSALRAYPRLRPNSNVEAWLVTIAHRKALDQIRRATRRRTTSIEAAPELVSHDRVPGSWEAELWEALAALAPKQRATVAYHYLGGLSYAEVAQVVGGSTDAARRAAADGIAMLRQTYLEGDV